MRHPDLLTCASAPTRGSTAHARNGFADLRVRNHMSHVCGCYSQNRRDEHARPPVAYLHMPHPASMRVASPQTGAASAHAITASAERSIGTYQSQG